MYSGNWNGSDGRSQRRERPLNLPQLPSLQTRSSFLEILDHGRDDIAIGWTPVSGGDGPSYPRSVISPISPMGRKHTKIRPPPPKLVPDEYTSPFVGEPNMESAHYTDSYISPFVGELSPIPVTPLETYDITTFYKKPPAPTSSRVASDNSGLSDGVDSYYSDSNYTFNNTNAKHSSFNSLMGGKPLELAPSITAPTQPFNIKVLDENKLYQCYSVYKLSDIYEWILKVYFEWFNEYVFGKIEFFQMVQLLLEFQMPKNFDQDTIDSNVDRIIESLVVQRAIRFENDTAVHKEEKNLGDNEIAIIVAGLDVNGIFTELLPCYSFVDNTYGPSDSTVCYSLTCHNAIQGEAREDIKISEIINKSVGLWSDYWHLTPEDIYEMNPREVQRQSFIFDLIILEERSLNMANAAVEIYGKHFDPSLLPDEPYFAEYAFETFRPLIQLHKEYLLTPIFWKLKTKGKFIDSIGKIYLKWCNEAKEIYLSYATRMAVVHEIITWEKNHGTVFANWIQEIDNMPEIRRSKMYHDVIFFGGFFKSLQNLPVTLSSILKNTDRSMEDYEYLTLVIKEVENLSALVDKAHGDAIDNRRLVRFSQQLLMSNSNNTNVGYVNLAHQSDNEPTNASQDKLDLGLADPMRKLLIAGNALRKRELWLEPAPVYIALLDNYFLITEIIIKNNQQYYKLVERPIPIDYLSLEQKKRRTVETAHTPVTSKRDLFQSETKKSTNQTVSTPISGVRPHLISAASTVSKTLYPTPSSSPTKNYNNTEISNTNPTESELSFKIRNTATSESFTFIMTKKDEKEQWITAILNCFKQLESVLPSKDALDLHILTTQFGYISKEAPANLPVAPEGSELDRALKIYEKEMQTSINRPEIPTTISCTVNISYEGRRFLLIATDQGILMRDEHDQTEQLKMVLQVDLVRRMEVNMKLNIVLVLHGRKLSYFNIPSLLGAFYSATRYLSNDRVVGIVISDKVGWFKFAEDFGNSRHLLYERKGKIVILTPEFDRITKILKFFKPYKEHDLLATINTITTPEIYDIVVFKNSFIVCTSKGSVIYHDSFNDEGLILPNFFNDNKMYSYMKQVHLTHHPFKKKIESSSKKNSSKHKMAEYVKKDIAANRAKPITCFKLSNMQDFLLVYDEAVIKINRHGQLADWTKDIMVLDFCCVGASFYNDYLLLVGDNLVQVYSLQNPEISIGELLPIQIIKGKKIVLLNSDLSAEPVLTLSHPNIAERQLLLTCRKASTYT